MALRDVILILGPNGAGKTHTARTRVLPRFPRALILESNFGEFPAQVFSDFGALLDEADRIGAWPGNRDNPRFPHDRVPSKVPFRFSYSPDPDEYAVCLDASRELCDHLLLLEEADRFLGEEALQEHIARGRHYNVSICAMSLTPVDFSKDLRRQVTHVISYRQTEPSDVDYLRRIIGEAAYELPTLKGPEGPDGPPPPYPFLEWKPNTGAKIITP